MSIVMTHQMRGEPLVMQDRKSIRQIRRYTKLLDRSGKPQQRFSDLLHPLNRTSNDHMLIRKGQIEEESDNSEDDDEDAASEQGSVDGGKKGRKTAGKKAKNAKSA